MTKLLSDSAFKFYERIVELGEFREQDVIGYEEQLSELRERGMVWFTRGDAMEGNLGRAVSPWAALGQLWSWHQHEISRMNADLTSERERWEAFIKSFTGCACEFPVDGLKFLDGIKEVTAAERDLIVASRHEIQELAVGAAAGEEGEDVKQREVMFQESFRFTLEAAIESGVKYRVACDPGQMAIAQEDISTTENQNRLLELRMLEKIPARILIGDETAIVHISSCRESALIVHRNPLLSAFRDYFEMLWKHAVPIYPPRSDLPRIPPMAAQVLSLLAVGLTDGVIAKSLKISTRSVRRHVESLQQLAGASNRITLGIAAVRNGWLRHVPGSGRTVNRQLQEW